MEKEIRDFFMASLIVAAITIISFLVPIKPKHGIGFSGASSTLAESMGIFPTIIFILIVSAVIFFIIIKYSKYFAIKKDLEKRDVIVFKTIVKEIEVVGKENEKTYIVHVEKNEGGTNLLRYRKDEFPNLAVGDNINVTIAGISQIIFSTEKVKTLSKYDNKISEITKKI